MRLHTQLAPPRPVSHLSVAACLVAGAMAPAVVAQSGGVIPPASQHAFAYNPARTSLVELHADLLGHTRSPAGVVEERAIQPLVSQLGLSQTGGSNRLQWGLGVCPEQQYSTTWNGCNVSSHLRAHAFKAGYASIKGTPRAITFVVTDNGGVDYLTIENRQHCMDSRGGDLGGILRGSTYVDYSVAASMQMPFVLRQESHVSTSDVHLDTSAVAIDLTDWNNHVRPCGVLVAEDLNDNGRYDLLVDAVRLSLATPQILMGPGGGSPSGGAISVDMASVGANLPAGKYVAKIDYARSSRAENADRELANDADFKGSLTSHGAFFGAIVVSAPVAVDDGGVLE